METKIVKLLESSIVLAARCTMSRMNGTNNAELKSSLAEALNKAKDASSLDRILHHEQDKQGENVFHNFDLTYAVSKLVISLIYMLVRLPFPFRCSSTWLSNTSITTCTSRPSIRTIL